MQIIRKKIRSFILRQQYSGQITLSVPLRASNKDINRFIENHQDWISKRQEEAATMLSEVPDCCLEPGQFFLFKGQFLEITNVPDDKDKLYLPRKKVRAYLKQQAMAVLEDRLAFFCKEYGFHYRGLSLRMTKSTWGSCTHDNKLNFNLNIIFMPMAVIDYLVVHELVHTIHKNHSKYYWQEVGKILPNYKTTIKLFKMLVPRVLVYSAQID